MNSIDQYYKVIGAYLGALPYITDGTMFLIRCLKFYRIGHKTDNNNINI